MNLKVCDKVIYRNNYEEGKGSIVKIVDNSEGFYVEKDDGFIAKVFLVYNHTIKLDIEEIRIDKLNELGI